MFIITALVICLKKALILFPYQSQADHKYHMAFVYLYPFDVLKKQSLSGVLNLSQGMTMKLPNAFKKTIAFCSFNSSSRYEVTECTRLDACMLLQTASHVFDDNQLKCCAVRQQGNLIFDGRADICVIAAGLCVGHRLAGRVADGNGYHR